MRKRVLSERLVEYSINVESWGYYYSYIAEPLTDVIVNEFVHLETLELRGKVDVPHKAGSAATIRIACEKSPADGEQIRYDRPVLGNLVAKAKLLDAYVLLPAEHVTRLTSVVASGKIKVVRLMATNSVGGKALIRNITVSTDFDS